MQQMILKINAFAFLAATTLMSMTTVQAGIAVTSGEKVAFLGDSITEGGWNSPVGYVQLVVKGLATLGINVKPIPAGISGHKSNDMLARQNKDVLQKKPDWMLVSCGVNDVWHGVNGVPLGNYKENMTAIVDNAQRAGVKVMILTATMIEEEPGKTNNVILAAYNKFLRQLASEKKCLLADLNTEMQEALEPLVAAGRKRGQLLTSDGVHMNPSGDQMMALGILKAFGCDPEQLRKAQEPWDQIADAVKVNVAYSLNAQEAFTLREQRALEAAAAKQKTTVQDLLNNLYSKRVDEILEKAGVNDPKSLRAQLQQSLDHDIKTMLQK